MISAMSQHAVHVFVLHVFHKYMVLNCVRDFRIEERG